MASVRLHPIGLWEVASWILQLPAINLRNSISEHTEFDHNLLWKVSQSVWIYWQSPLEVSDGKIYLSYLKTVAFGTQLKSFNRMKFSFKCAAAHMKFNQMNSVREDEKVIFNRLKKSTKISPQKFSSGVNVIKLFSIQILEFLDFPKNGEISPKMEESG